MSDPAAPTAADTSTPWWFEIDSWHILAQTWNTPADIPMAESLCGIEHQWNGVKIDHLPGGSEKTCENCLMSYAGQGNGKKKGRPKKSE